MKKLRKTISFRYLFPCTLLMVLQIVLLILTIYFGATFTEINTKTVETFETKVNLKRNYLETLMIDSWGSLGNDYDRINSSISSFYVQDELDINNDKVFESIQENIYLMLRKNKVTEAFVILDPTSEFQTSSGIYLRDLDPANNSTDYSDILIEVAPSSIRDTYRNQGFDLSTVYTSSFTDLSAFHSFEKIKSAVEDNPNKDYKSFGYWSEPISFHDSECITYTLPLVYKNKVYGVMGIGILTSVLQTQFLDTTLQNEDLSNLALVKQTSDSSKILIKNCKDAELGQLTNWASVETKYSKLYKMTEIDGYYLSMSKISLYSEDSPYSNEEWGIIGLISEDELFQGNTRVLNSIIYAALIAVCITISIEVLVGVYVTHPIRRLIDRLSKNGIPSKKTNIYEIDLLLSELQDYEQKVYELPKKMNQIIEMTGILIATFEIEMVSHQVTLGKQFYELLNLEPKDNVIPLEEFQTYLQQICKTSNLLSLNNHEYPVSGTGKWVKFRVSSASTGFIGAVLDVTPEIIERIQIEEERDHDYLTGLLNRRGFFTRANSIFDFGMKEALMMMIDLDNLKKLNDSYGHDVGDAYIKRFGDILLDFSSSKALCCHLSGDEFLILLHHYPSKEEILQSVHQFEEMVNNAYLQYYDVKIQLSLSCGMVFYDNHATLEELRKEADFAMYEIKGTSKGGFNFFEPQRYHDNSLEISLKEKFMHMINQGLIDYHYQPIVSLKTGEILGYEALMRPQLEEFRSPVKTLEMAKKLNVLDRIENLSISKAIDGFRKFKSNKLLFINSIADQVISEEQYNELVLEYGTPFKNVVVEITEEEALNVEAMNSKLEYMRKNGSTFAIDDYGTGYNTILSITKYKPSFVKINSDFISGIHLDSHKQELVQPLVSYCHMSNILVIAECVEVEEELKTVIELGFDYVQGYLIAKPSPSIEDLPLEKKDLILKL